MTIGQMAAVIGREGTVEIEAGLRVGVVVLDVKQAFGRTDYSVAPLRGEGSKWVSADRVKLNA